MTLSQRLSESVHVQAVALALSCLSYDFIGTCLDESSEDLGTIQVQYVQGVSQGHRRDRLDCMRPVASDLTAVANGANVESEGSFNSIFGFPQTCSWRHWP